MFIQTLEPRMMLTAVSVSDVSAFATDGNATFTVKLDKAHTSDLIIPFTEVDGTAKAGRDYTRTAGSLTITAGQTSGTITVPVLDHGNVNGDRTFKLRLQVVSSTIFARAVIHESFPTVLFSNAAYSSHVDSIIAEGSNGPFLVMPKKGTRGVTVTVKLSKKSSSTVKVGYSWIDGTAVNGQDYQASPGTLTFQPGQTSKKITLKVLPNLVAKPNDLTFSLDLAAANAGARVIPGPDQVFKIAAHDAAGNVTSTTPLPTKSNSTHTVTIV